MRKLRQTSKLPRHFATKPLMRVLPVLLGVVVANGGPDRVHADDGVAPSVAGLSRLSAYFENEIATGKIPGAIVLIQQHGMPIYLRCFGVRDVETREPMTPDTIFAIHSMTKPVTSLAAMMLIEEGKLALSDPVSKYVPAFADVKVGVESGKKDGVPILTLEPPTRQVTIEDLLRHTSGISYGYIGGEWVMKAYSDAHIF